MSTTILNDTQLVALATDLLALKQRDEFPKYGEHFTLSLPHLPNINTLAIHADFGVTISVSFSEYPSTSVPKIEGENWYADELPRLLGEYGTSPFHILDIVKELFEIGGCGGTHLPDEFLLAEQEKNTSPFLFSQVMFQVVPLSRVPTRSSWIADNSLVIVRGIHVISTWCLVVALVVSFVILCALVLLSVSPTVLEKMRIEMRKNKKRIFVTKYGRVEEPSTATFAQPETKTIRSYPVKSVYVPVPLLLSIMKDYSTQHHPNEYQFLLSGQLKEDGSIFLRSYYPSVMEISTPVYSQATEAYNREVIFIRSPRDHVIIVWAHVQPIEDLSRTDKEFYANTAKWDQKVGEMYGKRSIAMTISSVTHLVRFYDIDTLALLPCFFEQ
jgi:hypothetical protein